MKLTTFACEVCQRPKGEANHWFLGYPKHGTTGQITAVTRWNVEAAYAPDCAHLCGLECVNKWVQQQLTKGETHA